jgi:hypothetical protein
MKKLLNVLYRASLRVDMLAATATDSLIDWLNNPSSDRWVDRFILGTLVAIVTVVAVLW